MMVRGVKKLSFSGPDDLVFFRLIHHGGDGWQWEFIRLVFDDYTHVHCPAGDHNLIDNDDYVDINCYP